MIRVVVTGDPQANATKPSTVNFSSEEVVTLGGDPSPPLPHPPGPAALSPYSVALLELARHVDKAHYVTHLFCDKLIAHSLGMQAGSEYAPWGTRSRRP
jgi:hypothetical protein